MGWNDWAHYGCSLTEAIVTANADALINTGLAAKGYDTVTLDDCWMSGSRDANGNLVANSSRFPHGMAWLGTYLHNNGLKFGIYEDAGSATCSGLPGSGQPQGGGADHFAADANLFASWGVDYLKLDGCNVYIPSGKTMAQAFQDAYDAQAAALRNSGRAITFSESIVAYFHEGEWGASPDYYASLAHAPQNGQLWRVGNDIAMYDSSKPTASHWSSVLNNYAENRWIGTFAGPGSWNDPDFLIGGETSLTDDEARSQISLWSMMAAPLILASDLTSLPAARKAAFSNADIIALDQDSAGHQGSVVSSNGTTDILTRPLANGDRAVAVLNRSASTSSVSVPLANIGLSGCTVAAKDLWSGTSSTVSGSLSASIPSHATAVWRLTPGSGCAAAVPTGQVVGAAAKCMDDSGSGSADGNPIILYTCTGQSNQRWILNTDGTVRTLGKCLTAGGTAAGSAAILSGCTGATAQKWTHRTDGTFTNNASGLCLDVYGGFTTDTTRLQVWTCGNHQTNQFWSLPA
ncbi:ricin-type beta-trefoil lectin domain protein [Kitasatospora sp. NPDC057015]|uniref:ricin-type beta-trefoil lectin domain protein n=1 Tax=Kitasatospora sp. NPDC057015 TaxID=3346001 RepID=UPI00363A50D1